MCVCVCVSITKSIHTFVSPTLAHCKKREINLYMNVEGGKLGVFPEIEVLRTHSLYTCKKKKKSKLDGDKTRQRLACNNRHDYSSTAAENNSKLEKKGSF